MIMKHKGTHNIVIPIPFKDFTEIASAAISKIRTAIANVTVIHMTVRSERFANALMNLGLLKQ